MLLVPRSKSCRLAAIALLALLVGQLAVLTHAAAVEHQPGEVCEVCVSTDRLSDALVSATHTVAVAPLNAVPMPATAAPIGARFWLANRSRGPPSL